MMLLLWVAMPFLVASAELCGTVKDHYKKAGCCGAPEKPIHTLMAARKRNDKKAPSILDEIPDFEPFQITPCNPLLPEGDFPCTNQCGTVRGFKCEGAGWVFCQNAVCDETP